MREVQRLLITACDPAAAFHLVEVARAALADDRFDTMIAAQGPALAILRTAGLTVRPVTLARVRERESANADALLVEAGVVLDESRPDVILCGLSTPFDGGFDEAILAQRQCPAYLMQDFWGEENRFFGAGPDGCFVLDDEAAALTVTRSGVPTLKVGSPRHAAYSGIDAWDMRRRQREMLNVPEDGLVVGLFGQGLHANPGYRRTLEAWCAAVLKTSAIPIYKPHPRESEDDVAYTIALLERHNLKTRIPKPSASIEEVICACDVVCAAFSNCLYDAAFLNHYSDRPLVSPLAMFFDPDIVTYFQSIVNLVNFPYLKFGLVEAVSQREDLAGALEVALQSDRKRFYWTNAKANLQNPGKAVALILDELNDQSLLKS